MSTTTKTKKSKAGRNVKTNNALIIDPEAPATRAQLKVIGQAVKAGQCERFPEEEWKAMTKGRASEVISELRANNDDVPASVEQKKKLSGLINRGFLKGYKKETFKALTNIQAKKAIYKGLQNEAAGITVEGYEPRETLAPGAPKTERQTERLTQLVHDGYLNPFHWNQFRKMTHEDASKFIGIGKSRQSQGIKAEPYVREPEAA